MKLPKELITVTKTSKILAAVVFIALPFLGFFVGTNYQASLDSASQTTANEPILVKRAPTPTPSQSIDTSNWKTYTNEKYGFSFKYPQTSKLSENSYGTIWVDKKIEIYMTKINPKDCRGDCPVIENAQTVNVQGQSAESLTGYIGAVGGNVPHSYESVVLNYNNQYYILTLHELPFDSKVSIERKIGKITEEDKQIFNQILQTFQFTN